MGPVPSTGGVGDGLGVGVGVRVGAGVTVGIGVGADPPPILSAKFPWKLLPAK